MLAMRAINDALKSLEKREGLRDEFRRFYRGEQAARLTSPELRAVFNGRCGFSVNLCKTVTDSLTDRVQVKAINATVSVDDESLTTQEREQVEDDLAKKATAAARAIWERSAIDITALAWRYSVDGDAWLALESGENGYQLTTLDNSRVVPTDIGVFVLTNEDKTQGRLINGSTITPYELGRDGEWRSHVTATSPLSTLLERVQNGIDGTEWGVSDIASAVPQQRVINQRVIDMHEVSGNAAWPQRWIVGQGASRVAGQLTSRAGAIHGLEAGESGLDLKEFAAADPTKLAAVIDQAVELLSVTTGTPLQSGSVGANASAESRRIAQDKLTRRVSKALDSITHAVSRLLESALSANGLNAIVSVDWESPEPVAAKDLLEQAMLKMSLGVSKYTILSELGYDPDREEMLRAAERAEEQVALTRAISTGTDTATDISSLLEAGDAS